MPTITKKQAVIGTTTVLLLGAIVVGIVLVTNKIKNREYDKVTAQGFSGVIARAKRKHPSIYAWWDSLSPQHQISIESMMTPELLTHLSQDFAKSNLSTETMELLTRAGYAGI
jgi:hypothetical protein